MNDVAQMGRAVEERKLISLSDPCLQALLEGRRQRVIFQPLVPGSSPGIVLSKRAEVMGYRIPIGYKFPSRFLVRLQIYFAPYGAGGR